MSVMSVQEHITVLKRRKNQQACVLKVTIVLMVHRQTHSTHVMLVPTVETSVTQHGNSVKIVLLASIVQKGPLLLQTVLQARIVIS